MKLTIAYLIAAIPLGACATATPPTMTIQTPKFERDPDAIWVLCEGGADARGEFAYRPGCVRRLVVRHV